MVLKSQRFCSNTSVLVHILCGIGLAFLSGCSTILSHSQSGLEEPEYAKRSLGAAIDDNLIIGRIEARIRAENEQFSAMINVDSYNKIVLLTGRVPDKSFIDKAVAIANAMPGVRQVHSEISKGQPTTISNYWYDTWLTTKTKSQLTLTSNAPANKTRVRSFAGTIYLMGKMTPQEAKNAIYVASRIPGAKKVISMIETIELNKSEALASPVQTPIQTSQGLNPTSSQGFAPAADMYETQPLDTGGFYNEYQLQGEPQPQSVQGL